MYKDKAIDEIRDRRKKLLLKQYNGSIENLINEAISWQHKNPQKVTHLRKIKLLQKAG